MGGIAPSIASFVYPAWKEYKTEQKKDQLWNMQQQQFERQKELWKRQDEEWQRKQQQYETQDRLLKAQEIGMQLFPMLTTMEGAFDPEQKKIRGELLAQYMSAITGKDYSFNPEKSQTGGVYWLENRNNPNDTLPLDRFQATQTLIPVVGKMFPNITKQLLTPQPYVEVDPKTGSIVKTEFLTPLQASQDPRTGKTLFYAENYKKQEPEKTEYFIHPRTGQIIAMPISRRNDALQAGYVPLDYYKSMHKPTGKGRSLSAIEKGSKKLKFIQDFLKNRFDVREVFDQNTWTTTKKIFYSIKDPKTGEPLSIELTTPEVVDVKTILSAIGSNFGWSEDEKNLHRLSDSILNIYFKLRAFPEKQKDLIRVVQTSDNVEQLITGIKKILSPNITPKNNSKPNQLPTTKQQSVPEKKLNPNIGGFGLGITR